MITNACESMKPRPSVPLAAESGCRKKASAAPSSGSTDHGAAPGQRPVKLLVVDDHPVVRKGITAYLSRLRHLQVVGEAADGQEALRRTRELAPDIVVMDIDMPRMNGLTAAEILHRELPRVKVLILSNFSTSEFVMRILQSGACGYVLKAASPEDLTKAIETLSGGEPFFSSEVARVALNQFVRGHHADSGLLELTARERQVLVGVAEGLSNKEIAMRLDVGVRTIETHRERIMRKLNIHTVAGLTKYALANGLVGTEGLVATAGAGER